MYITYDKISECSSFVTWLVSSWGFVNKNLIREWGIRFLGIVLTNYSDKPSEKEKMKKLKDKQYAKLQKEY